MALQLTDQNVAHQIAERIRSLIARNDDGDVIAAAHRLERPIADVYLPERIIASGDGPAALEFLAMVVRTYEVDVCWLVTGLPAQDASSISNEARGTIVELIDELSDILLDEARHEGPWTPLRGVPARIDAASRPH